MIAPMVLNEDITEQFKTGYLDVEFVDTQQRIKRMKMNKQKRHLLPMKCRFCYI